MTKTILTIATRESPLALWQANWVKTELEKYHPTLSVKLLGLTTTADKTLDIPLTMVGGKGLFVKELEDALLEERADIAVHSMKDVPMELPSGLYLPVMCQREDPRDVYVSPTYPFVELPHHSPIGTSSLRRQSQLAALRPDLRMEHCRGNVNTRLSKLDRGEYAGIILAAAGLKRLNLQARIGSFFTMDEILPAPGQGVLGIECRENDSSTQAFIAPLNHLETNQCVSAERAMCQHLQGGCQVPVAAYAMKVDNKIFLRGLVASPDGSLILRAEHTGPLTDARDLGTHVAEDLLLRGAGKILASLGLKT